MNRAIGLGLLTVPLLAGIASADVTFSNVNIYGTLVDGASYATDGNTIDFIFPDATVGAYADSLLLNVLGALSGSGLIYWNEVVVDLDTNQNLVKAGGILDSNDDLPLSETLNFSATSTHFKVKKTFFLSAINTRDFDLANIGLIEQDIHEVPSPGAASMALLAMGGLVSLRRRRSV